MRLDNLVSLIGGELQNNPSITQICSFSFRPQQVRRGSLFLVQDQSQIDEAIKAGAYALVYDTPLTIKDKEIAWIKVPNLQTAALRLVRFLLLQSQIPAIGVTPLELDLAKALFHDKKFHIFTDPFTTLHTLQERRATLLLYPAHLEALHLNTPLLPAVHIHLTQSYLFESSFIFEDRLYERIRLPKIFLPALQKLLSIAKKYGFEPQFGSLESFSHFKPFFVNHTFKPVEFGKSEKVLILEPNEQLVQMERNYLQSKASWAKLLFLSSEKLPNVGYYSSIDELKEILYNTQFNFALIHSQNLDIATLERPRREQTFF